MQDAASEGLDEKQLEIAFGVVSMFNYFTRVADATGIEFDYQTPLPAFKPDLRRTALPRPDRPDFPDRSSRRRHPRDERLRGAWGAWRAYQFDGDGPLGPNERRLLAAVAAEEAADWECADAFGGTSVADNAVLADFARKLSREPWNMEPGDLEKLRTSGYSELAILRAISLVAHQNADSRLAVGLAFAGD
ncbi:MAG TPA: hypothetical protein VN695_01015 [Streptosporangiaceae bacterium]|nr:hypothetical protein [Streptosporangiaceae bacterium]